MSAVGGPEGAAPAGDERWTVSTPEDDGAWLVQGWRPRGPWGPECYAQVQVGPENSDDPSDGRLAWRIRDLLAASSRFGRPDPEEAERARELIRRSDDLPREGEGLIAAALRILHADVDPADLAEFDDPRDRAARVLHSLHSPSISWSACERAATALVLTGVLAPAASSSATTEGADTGAVAEGGEARWVYDRTAPVRGQAAIRLFRLAGVSWADAQEYARVLVADGLLARSGDVPVATGRVPADPTVPAATTEGADTGGETS